MNDELTKLREYAEKSTAALEAIVRYAAAGQIHARAHYPNLEGDFSAIGSEAVAALSKNTIESDGAACVALGIAEKGPASVKAGPHETQMGRHGRGRGQSAGPSLSLDPHRHCNVRVRHDDVSQVMNSVDRKAINTAAEILRMDADSLHESHTVNGAWPAGEEETMREHNLMRRLARQLERIAAR